MRFWAQVVIGAAVAAVIVSAIAIPACLVIDRRLRRDHAECRAAHGVVLPDPHGWRCVLPCPPRQGDGPW